MAAWICKALIFRFPLLFVLRIEELYLFWLTLRKELNSARFGRFWVLGKLTAEEEARGVAWLGPRSPSRFANETHFFSCFLLRKFGTDLASFALYFEFAKRTLRPFRSSFKS